MTDQSALARPTAQTPPQANWFSRKIHKSETFRAYAVLSPALLFLGFAILIPFAILVVLSFWTPVGFDFNREFTLKNYRDIMERPIYGTLLWRSLWISTMATVFTVLLCYPMAYFVAFHVHRNKMVWIVLMTLPFWTSYLLRVFAWKVVLGYEGVINSGLIWVGWIEAPLQFLLYSPTAVIITLAHAWAAFAILPLYVSLEKIDKSLLEAATDLGDGPMRRFFRITLPLSLPGVISASILIFIPTTGDYITPALLGGPNGMMIGNLIQMQFGPTNNWPMGAALAIVLMLTIAAICAAFILIIFFVRKRIT
jgi:spermidine/putrescine transport system permease protein